MIYPSALELIEDCCADRMALSSLNVNTNDPQQVRALARRMRERAEDFDTLASVLEEGCRNKS